MEHFINDDSLNLIKMSLYDLQEQTMPSVRSESANKPITSNVELRNVTLHSLLRVQ